MKKLLGLAIVIGLMGFTAFATITGLSPKQAGPFFYAQTTYPTACGGAVRTYLTGTNDTEKIGNVVYLTQDSVKHSATLANYNSLAGVVVGGANTSMKGSCTVADTGAIAAFPGQQVLVLYSGRAYVLVDTEAGFAAGTGVVPSVKSAMAGRLAARGTAIDTFYRIFGKTADTAVSGKAVLVDVRVK